LHSVLSLEYFNNFVFDSQDTLFAFGNYFVDESVTFAVQFFQITFSNMSLLFIFAPITAFVFLREEIKKIDVTLVQRVVRGLMLAIIISMIIVSPFSMSGFYWPAVIATNSSDNTTASVADSLPPNTNGTISTEDTTSSFSNTTASVADSTPPYTNGTTTEDTTSYSNATSTDYNGTTEYEPVIVPNATKTWEFDNSVNGS